MTLMRQEEYCMNYRCYKPILIFASMCLSVSMALAQGNKGRIDGRVVDSSGSALQGTQVTLQPGGLSRVSDP